MGAFNHFKHLFRDKSGEKHRFPILAGEVVNWVKWFPDELYLVYEETFLDFK